MRYENWDVLLFPGSDHVPLREFRTECHVVPDAESLPLSRFGVPTLNTFVPSLHYNSPFSISILSWGKPSVSLATRSYSNHPELVLFEFHVYIDGRLVSTAILDQNMKGPYSIQHCFVLTKKGEIDSLRFPAFHSGKILQQRFWNPGDDFGRIKIIMTESFPRDSVTMPFERVKNVIAFSFQHAPLEILESSAIAWPNPTMWQSTLSNNVLSKPELSEPKSQSHLRLCPQKPVDDAAYSHPVLSAVACLQPPTKSDKNNPSLAQGRMTSGCSPDSDITPGGEYFAACHDVPHSGVFGVTAGTTPIQRDLCKFLDTIGSDHASSLFSGLNWLPDACEMPINLAGPSHVDLMEQCGQTVRSRLPTSTFAAADNVLVTDANSGLSHCDSDPKTRVSSPESVLRHLGPWSAGIQKAALPATKVISRKECRTLQHSVESTVSLDNATTTIISPGAGQNLPEPVYALIGSKATAGRTPSLQLQPQKLLEVPEAIRRSVSFGANVTNAEQQEAVLSAKRGQGNRNFTPLFTQEVAGGTQLHG